MDLTVVIPTHNPDVRRLRATLEGLRRQTLAPDRWKLLLIDNASTAFPAPDDLAGASPTATRIVREPTLGLTAARCRGVSEAQTPLVVFVDDDNVLAPDYLDSVARIFATHPHLGLIGGKSLPGFEVEPPPWVREFDSLLALRDLGEKAIVSPPSRAPDSIGVSYPTSAPVGAGMAARTAALQPWLDACAAGRTALTDRRGQALSSSGDNEIVFCALRAGWHVGYFPELRLAHLIPAGRLDPDYLARLNFGIQHSWMRVLRAYDSNPWPPLTGPGAWLRQCKAWFTHRAWRGPVERIRWAGARGHFSGRTK